MKSMMMAASIVAIILVFLNFSTKTTVFEEFQDVSG
jgi:hypothetical protein